MYIISDLVKRDQQAEFRNDVQLSSYEDENRNFSLVRSYLFTSAAPQGYASSTSVLHALMDSYLNERLENRFIVIANYGHGKSHLALALANYFGKPYNSRENEKVLKKINQAFSNSSNALRYQEFKENRGEFLVVRIRGDAPGSLKEQFLNSLEKELGEHSLPGDHHLPGWYSKAEKYLAALKSEKLQKANTYLDGFETDVPMLIQDIQKKRDRAYDLFENLYAHLDEHGWKPNMRGELSLDRAICWASDEFCSEGKPLGGIIILFDEFNLYITNYAQRSAAGDLQDLLNGVSNRQGKVAFLAFAQQDPVTIAQNVLAVSTTAQRESLLKELSRIPKQFILYSLMESVIDSYLIQPNDVWQMFSQDSSVSLPLSQATNIALDQFKDRYDKIGWTSIETFVEKVTKGCFPLHPITTALLCSVQFQQSVTASGTPRNILGFILEKLDQLADKPVLIGKRMNWILPIDLVDYFGERLPAERYQAYKLAIQRINADDEDSEYSAGEQNDIIKALLLQEIAKLKARDEDQLDLIASMVGMSPSDAKKCLRSLSDAKVIGWDQGVRKSYSLWSTTFNPYKLDQILEQKLGNISLDWNDLLTFSKNELDAIPVSIPWGNQGDWQAPEYIIDTENFTPQTLMDLASRFRLDSRGSLQEGDRGKVIWLIARNEDEVNGYIQNAQKTLDDAQPNSSPLPVILMLPLHPNYGVLDALRRKKALDLFNATEKEEAGEDAYRLRCTQETTGVRTSISLLRGGENYRDLPHRISHYIVPSPYRAQTQQLGQVNLLQLLDELYKAAYPFSPPDFFQYPLTNRAFRSVVQTIATDLLHNDSNSLIGTIRRSNARDVVVLLQQKWQILSSDYRVRIPENSRIAQAWEFLEQYFPASGQENTVRTVLLELMNPPYGYDYNTATLIFSIWFGFNVHDLQISAKGELINAKAFDGWIEKGVKEFLVALCMENVSLARRDATSVEKEVKDTLLNIKNGAFSISEAQNAIAILADFVANDRNDAHIIEEAQQGIDRLKTGLKLVQEYEERTQKTLTVIANEKRVKLLFEQLQVLGNLTESTLVLSNALSVSDLRTKLMGRMEDAVKEQCASLENLRDIADLTYNRSQLDILREDISKAGLSTLTGMVDEAIQTLAAKGDQLRDKAQETKLQNYIKSLNPTVSLQNLLNYRTNLVEITNAASETMKLRSQQLAIIDDEISKLENFASRAEKDLENAEWRDGFEKFQQKLYQYNARYEGTKYHNVFKKLLERAAEIRKFYEEIMFITERKFESVEVARETKRLLNSIGRKYLTVIGEPQRVWIEKAQSILDDNIARKERDALNWFNEQEAQFEPILNYSQLRDLRNRLEKPPSFYPEKEKNHIEDLIILIDKRLDENVVQQIETYFMSIKDEEVRRQCIARLQTFLEEKSS